MLNLLEALRSGRVLLMDGAMGSELRRAGLCPPRRPEDWNLDRPDAVRDVHRAHVEAGAEILLTNTFQANPAALADRAAERPGFLRDTFRAAALIAAEAAGPTRLVLTDVGPMVGADGTEFADLAAADAVATAIAETGCSGVLLETCSSARVGMAIERFRRPGRAILLSLTYRQTAGGYATLDGRAPEWFAERAAAWGAAALGVNCGPEIDVADCAAIVRRYRGTCDLPLFARPNAGTPQAAGADLVYPRTPDMMAAQLPELLDAGAVMIGGCCGTTPAHIAAFKRVIDSWNQAVRKNDT